MEYTKGMEKERRLLWIGILLNCFIVLFLSFFSSGTGIISSYSNFLLLIIAFMLFMIPIIFMHKENKKLRSEIMSSEEKIKNLKDINYDNRILYHDYKNHITVIQGLVTIGKNEILKKYIQSLIGETNFSSINIETGIEELDIFLKARYSHMRKNDIKLNYSVENPLQGVDISNFDLFKLVSNIIDNAIDELKSIEKLDKRISLRIKEEDTSFSIIISNNGRKIPDQVMQRIFHIGISTKEGENRGCGLHIVKSIIKKSKGNIEIESSDKETKFLIEIPKEAKDEVSA